MDKNRRLGSKKILILWLILFAQPGFALASSKPTPSWKKSLQKSLARLERRYPKQIGIYVKDLDSEENLSFHGDESWYIASGVKLPIALEVLQQVEAGKLSLDSKIELAASDYIDGAGETNRHAPGTRLSIQYLLEQMLQQSDNTASDLLIRSAGKEAINQSLARHIPSGFGKITTLADVRRHAYQCFHPAAFQLSNSQIRELHALKSEKKKLKRLARLLGVSQEEFKHDSLQAGYAEYYAKKLNSASLDAYGRLLEKVVEGSILKPATTVELLRIMTQVETGKKRIRSGLPSHFHFAHKTGTQLGRVCDLGVAWDKNDPQAKRVVIAACTRNISSRQRAEKALKAMGRAVHRSGIFSSNSAS